MSLSVSPALRGGRRLLGILRSSVVLRLGVKRVIIAIPVLWGVTFLTFVFMNLLPGNGARQLLGAEATPDQVRQLEMQLGLDKPFLVRYLDWLGGVLSGHLGASLGSGQPVLDILGQRLPVTLELGLYGLIVSVVLTVPVALLAVRRPGGLADRLSMAVSVLGLSFPNFVLAILLVLLLAVTFTVFPAIGYVPLSVSFGGNIRSLTLPAAAMGIPLFCYYTRLLRGDLLEQMQGEDYVVTARAKGISAWRVLARHALRNSMFGFVTMVGLNLGALLGGTVIIEQIFSLPGIGRALVLAINGHDVVLVQAIVLLLACAVVLANLLTDIVYMILDPRIRYGSS
jgi:peptide/nickel transport system permease protein